MASGAAPGAGPSARLDAGPDGDPSDTVESGGDTDGHDGRRKNGRKSKSSKKKKAKKTRKHSHKRDKYVSDNDDDGDSSKDEEDGDGIKSGARGGMVFLETGGKPGSSAARHTFIQAVPVPRNASLDAPMYFKQVRRFGSLLNDVSVVEALQRR